MMSLSCGLIKFKAKVTLLENLIVSNNQYNILQFKTIESWEIFGEIVRSKNLNTTKNKIWPHCAYAANLCKDVADHDYYEVNGISHCLDLFF